MATFRVGEVSPADYLRAHLAPPAQPLLANEQCYLPVFYNVVSNVKLDPPGPVPLLYLMTRCPNSEIKSNFGALIMRFMHTLTNDQAQVPLLKASSTTHLCFAKGALDGTGNRSEDEARLTCHEFRLFLYHICHLRTNMRRFTIVNMVCSTSLPHCVDLSRLHADNQISTDYYPDLFPGLFFYYKFIYKDRQDLHQAAETGTRKVQLLEDDLMQLQMNTSAGRNNNEETVRAQVKGMLDSYLPRHKYVTVLVFLGGKMVGLGVHNRDVAMEAFEHVGRIAITYRISAKEAEAKRKRASDRLHDKTAVMHEQHINHARPFSNRTQNRIREELSRIENSEERSRRMRQILEEEKASKLAENRKRKRKGAAADEEDEEFADALSSAGDSVTNETELTEEELFRVFDDAETSESMLELHQSTGTPLLQAPSPTQLMDAILAGIN